MPEGRLLSPAAPRVETHERGGVLLHVRFDGGQVQADGTLERREVVVRLDGGPCDGQFARVLGYGKTCWQRIPGATPFWAKYVRTERGVYTWAEHDAENIIDLVRMAEKIAAQGRGNVSGSSGA